MGIARKGIIDNVPATILSNIKWYKTINQQDLGMKITTMFVLSMNKQEKM
jgi:hypothetical protein